MRKTIEILFTLLLGTVFGIVIHGTIQAHSQPQITEPEVITEYVYIESEPEIVTEYVYIEKESTFYRDLTDDDAFYYCDLAMRESEGEGIVGMLWVMYTMECRCEAYGLTPEEVWESDAFSSSWSRRGIEPNENCLKALAIFEQGWIPKPLWFRADHYHGFGNPLCQVGKHYFSCK